ncbi:MAG: hypothetical protein RLZZ360_232 [Candidatus Parcubacteria bacterium]|jgi:hypothetical protein
MEYIRHDSLIQVSLLSANEDFYNNVFKKTERIISAAFYLTTHLESSKTYTTFKTLLEEQALTLHGANLQTLAVRVGDSAALVPLQAALVAVDSTLTIMSGARVFSGGLLVGLSDEIDQVLRYLKHHVVGGTNEAILGTKKGIESRSSLQTPREIRPRRIRPHIPKNDMSSEAVLVYSDLGDRTTRIKTVLEAKPDATIKDLTDIITDVSSKTIQRDLNMLIERGDVIRHGERRWSTYSLASSLK